MSEPSPPMTFYGHAEMTLDASTPMEKAQKSKRRGIASEFEGSFLPTEKGREAYLSRFKFQDDK